MEKEFFPSSIQPSMQFDNHFSSLLMPTWQTLEIQPHDCFLSTPPPHQAPIKSALSSMVSSPAGSSSALSNDNFIIRELIGKLGNICSSNAHHPPPPYMGAGSGGGGGGNCSNNNSCYSTPLSSPPKMGMPMPMQIMDHLVQENFPSLGNSIPLSSNLPAMPGDPGFAERAARFYSFGSRSFNGSGGNGNNMNANYSGGNGKLQRVSSSPSLKEAENNKSSLLLQHSGQDKGELLESRENSSISSQDAENGSSRKRKAAAPKGKSKEIQSQSPLSSNTKIAQNVEDSSAKRSKLDEGSEAKTGENKEDDGKKQENANQKPPEPPKDYIHVRARRGQATDSHSLAERVRREKISERMKLLQDLVPGCDKVTGKALMLDEIINYVQSLQRQVEFLSMKLANVNPRLEFNMGNLFTKEVIQQNSALAHPMYPLDSLAPTLYGQPPQNPLQDSIPTTAPCSMDPLNPTINQNHALNLPTIDGYSNGLPQVPSLCEGDLQSIVQMGFGQKENGFQSQPYMGQIHHH